MRAALKNPPTRSHQGSLDGIIRKIRWLVNTILLLVIAANSGCQSPQAQATRQNTHPAQAPALTSPTEQQPTAESPILVPTAVLAGAEDQPDLELPSAATEPPAAPLDFAFPQAGPEPVSLWRPPLYPTPWEPSPQDHFYFTRPIGADSVNWPLARYRYGYIFYTEPHTGIDIPAPKGTPILAAGPGTITHAGYGLYFMREDYRDPYGIAVAIKHDFGYQGQVLYTIYGHLDQVFVTRGQHVEGGEVIGLVGETGKVSGPHLHLEVRVGDYTFFATRNPELWISPPQGWGVLVGRVEDSSGDKLARVKAKLVHQETGKVYEVISYGEGSVNSDPYYDENLVLGDLPAGHYTLYLDHDHVIYKTEELVIQAGQVSFFNFRMKQGFNFIRPEVKTGSFAPPDGTSLIDR